MNYVRGAFSAVTSYYTNLPPINASTLTGAIDVIVVERRDEATGETELACSPFHVRLGKWQVLRPGEKQVTVLVNGKPIPYSMKIGDAGEAFFVFETEEDVPEELMTSPILGPTQDASASQQTDGEAQRQHETAGRFAAHPDPPSSDSKAPGTSDQRMNEPSFLDLDGALPSPSTTPTSTNAPPSPVNGETTISPASNSSTSLLEGAKTVLKAGPALAKSVLSNAPNTALDSAKKVRDLKATLGEEEEATPNRSMADLDDEAAQAPDVRYGKDVVLDMGGYHNAEAVVDEAGGSPSSSSTPPTNERNEPFPPSEDDLPLPLPQSRPFVRGGSAPPELDTISTSPPDYTWEWGAFPTPSPARRSFTHPHPHAKDDSNLGKHVVTAASEEEEEEEFGRGGTLSPDGRDDKLFWVTMEGGKKFSFELSLCGGGGGGKEDKKRRDDVESATWFEDRKIQYARLLSDPQVVQREELVMKWNDRFIFPQDNSPLFSALSHWRHAMKPAIPTPPPPPSRPIPSSQSDPELSSSPPTSPGLPPSASMISSSSPSKRTSWAPRWWTRTRDREDSSSTVRPSLPPPANSAPAELIPESPPIEPTKSIPVPATRVALPESRASSPTPPEQRRNYVKTLRLTSDQLKTLELKKGANTITFSMAATGAVACTAKIFVWDAGDHVVVSDIDGTITKSDALGHMFNLIGRDWTHMGVAKLYTDIARNGYKMMYLTSRAIGQADSTRDYLKGIKQNNYMLPEGPVIMSPDRLMASLHREVIMRKPEVFKMACLRDIQRLFGPPASQTPFYAGFGNRITDALSYRSVNVPSARIFTIDSSGEVKMELLELAGYKSSYIHMTDLVDQMFPPIHRKWAPQYTDFNYWRDPIPDVVDLPPELLAEPASPALSAVSDSSSRFSRIRNFSLRGSPSTGGVGVPVPGRTTKETSPSPLVRSVLSSSADDGRSATLVADSDEERRMRRRKLSFDSIPGSLPGSDYEDSEDPEEEEDDEEEGEEDEEVEPEPPVFDDDLFNELDHVRTME